MSQRCTLSNGRVLTSRDFQQWALKPIPCQYCGYPVNAYAGPRHWEDFHVASMWGKKGRREEASRWMTAETVRQTWGIGR